ncbi:hypothetical protein WA016_02288 [Myxococcus stipitatus]
MRLLSSQARRTRRLATVEAGERQGKVQGGGMGGTEALHGLPGMAPSRCVEQEARVGQMSAQARTGTVPCEFWSGTVIASMKAPNTATPP